MRHTSTTTVELSDAARYMKQLCRHFGHKVEATFDDHAARVVFPGADASFAVRTPTALEITIDADDADAGARFQDVVVRHLEKFAFREELTFAWRDTADTAG